MVFDYSWVDQDSFFLGAGFVLAFLIISSITDLICSLANWILQKAAQLRKARIGDQPSLVDRIRKKLFPPDDAA